MKTFTLKETKHPDVFRVVDRDGNWENYYVKSKNAYLPSVTTTLKRGYAKGAFFEKWLANHTAEEQQDILDAAAEKGDRVHRAIDLILNSSPEITIERETAIFNRELDDFSILANEEWDALLAFSSFWKAHEPVVIASESTLYSTAYGYAGTADAILILTKKCDVKACKCEELVGQVGIWDWKTSSGIKASYSAQVAAYAYAGNLPEYLPKDGRVDYTAILRIGTNHKTTGGYELKSFLREETAAAFDRFIAAKRIADFEHKPFNPDEDIQDIPDTIELTVKKFDQAEVDATLDLLKAAAKQNWGPTTEQIKAEIKSTTTKNGERKKGNAKAGRRTKAPARHKAA